MTERLSDEELKAIRERWEADDYANYPDGLEMAVDDIQKLLAEVDRLQKAAQDLQQFSVRPGCLFCCEFEPGGYTVTRIYQAGATHGIGLLFHGPGDKEAIVIGAQNSRTHRPYPAHRGDVVVDPRVQPRVKIIIDRDAKLLRGPSGFRGWIAHGFVETPVIKQINEPAEAERKEWVA